MRQDYSRFVALGAEILVLGPDGPNAFRRYWAENDMPFPGLADVKSQIAGRFDQEFNLFKLGRMPALLVIDRQGVVRYRHDGSSMADIPENETMLDVIAAIRQEDQEWQKQYS